MVLIPNYNMKILTAEEVKKKYGEQALASLPTTVPQKPSYLSRVGSEISGNVNQAIGAEKASISGAQNPFAAGASIAKNVTNIPLAPITQVLKPITDKVAPYIGAVFSKLGDTPAGQAFKSVVNKHPELSQAIFDVAQTGLNVGAIYGGVEATKSGYNTVKTGVNKTVQGTQDLVSSGKQSLYGNPNQKTFVDDLLNPKLSAGQSTKLIKSGKVTEGQGLLGQRDFSGSISGYNDIKAATAEVPGVSPRNTYLENVNAIHSDIGTIAQDLESQVGQEKSFFSPNKFKSLMNNVKSTLGENPTIVGDAETAASKVATKFESLVKEYGYNSKGLLQARKALDKWILVQKGAKVFSPATESGITTAISEIRQAGNDFLAEISPNTAVKALLKKQTNLYRAIDLVAPKAATEGNSLLSQYIKSSPIMVKAGKLLLEGTAMGKAARLLQ